MRDPHLDTRTSSTLSRAFLRSFPALAVTMLFLAVAPAVSHAEVFVPEEEHVGYLDSSGIFTVVGNVKNGLDVAVIPVVTVPITDESSQVLSRTIKHVPLAPGTEIPFKVKFPDAGKNPVLLPVEIRYEKTAKDAIPIAVLYDDTLKKHGDGHLTGRMQNTGTETIYNPKIFAVVHGYERVLDTAQNMEKIDKIEPGEIVEFTMYPDPAITDDVFYYSCFAPVDTTVIPITAKKNDGDYDFRYDSGAWYSAAKFDEKGTTLTIRGYNSYPLETYANFEFPQISPDEKFHVTMNGEPIEFLQSVDEMGFWHVVFSVAPTSQGTVKISGFGQGLPPEMSPVPQWVKTNTGWWSTGQISDLEFLEGIDFLTEKQIISVETSDAFVASENKVPQWVKDPAAWWSTGQISDDDFLRMIENLISREIVLVR